MSWFKRNKSTQFREVVLHGEVGSVNVPADFTVQDEDDSTVLVCPPGQEDITIRFSSISFSGKDGDETAGRTFLKKKAQEKGLNYFEINGKAVLSYEKESEHEGVPLLIQFWEVGARNTIVIISATIIKSKRNGRVVKDSLHAVPAMLESLNITKLHKVIEVNGKKVNATVKTVDSVPQTITNFDEVDLDWLKASLEQARALGVKYGSSGELGPEELDKVFSRWMHESGAKEDSGRIANALGAAFGAYLVQRHDFEWVVVTDEFGAEYAVKHKVKDSIAFPRASVEKRIEDKEPEFFEEVYILILDTLQNLENK